MKYYAVTEDPTELMHYGVKGMKWGQHIFGDKPKSPAFKKAATKLRASMKKNSERRQAKRDAKEAKLNAQATARLNEALGRQAYKSAKQEQRAVKREMRRENAAERREERQMNRYLQKARHGTLKYKKLRDDQIQSVAERLNLENQARRLSGNETPHMLTRIKRSIGEGVVRGVGSAVAIGIEEGAKARARYHAERKYGAKQARIDAEKNRIASMKKRENDLANDLIFAKQEDANQRKKDQLRILREADNEIAKEYYNEKAKRGEQVQFHNLFGASSRVKRSVVKDLAGIKEFNKNLEDTKKRLKEQDEKRMALLEEQRQDAKRHADAERDLERRMQEYSMKKGVDLYYSRVRQQNNLNSSIPTFKKPGKKKRL